MFSSRGPFSHEYCGWGQVRRGRVAWDLCVGTFVCDLGLHSCQVNHFAVTSRKIAKNCVGK